MKKGLTIFLILVCLTISVQGQKFNVRQSTPATIIVAASNSANKNTPYVCAGSSSDEDTINAALVAGKGGKVSLLEGLYVIDGSILVDSNTTLTGCGYGTQIKIANSVTSTLIMISNSNVNSGNTNIKISDLYLNGNNSNVASGQQIGIGFTYVTNSIIENCRIEHLGRLATASCMGIEPITCSNIKIKNNTIGDVVNGINSGNDGNNTNCSYLDVQGNTIYNTNRDYGLNIAGCDDSVWSNNIIAECFSEGINVITSNRNTISNNQIRNCGRRTNNTYSGINMASGSSCIDNYIAHNIIRNASSGNLAKYGISITNSTAVRNKLLFNDLYSSGYTADLYISDTTKVLSLGNITTRQTTDSLIRTKKITISHVGHSGTQDFTFTTAENTTEQVIDCGAIVPAFARVLDVQLINTQAAVFSGGATTLMAEIGSSSSGAEYVSSATIYAVNTILSCATGTAPIAASSSSVGNVYVSATPGRNWSEMTAGQWTLLVTYVYSGLIK